MMRILVTGSTGFIGGALCAALVEKGYLVRAFHRSSSDLTLLKDLPVEHFIGDLTHQDSLQAGMQGIDAVFHTAALLGTTSDIKQYYAITVRGTRALLDAAMQNGVQRVIHTSSIAALGVPNCPSEMIAPKQSPIMNEHSTWNIKPVYWPYGYSKYLAELEIQKAVASGLDVVITNPSYVVGPGDIYRTSNSPFIQIANHQVPFIPTGGVNIVHIHDVVNGHLAALEYGKRGERYILANENLTFKQLFEKISKQNHTPIPKMILPGRVVRPLVYPLQILNSIINFPLPVELFRYAGYGFYVNNQKSITDLNLTYQYSADDAVRDAYVWFEKNKV
ncbi:MAG: NAD-dependent epimerase/dehydratase family protein [Anaerolineaceae bacterium]|nr:NAD-dependent epimerase/dehydratase family protein [Anaerolineaceae bacterium]